MRPIDLSLARRQIPDALFSEVGSQAERLKKCQTNEERDKLIASKSQVWRDLKEHLGLVSQNKCWYCESPCGENDFRPVDHFRPKGSVEECAKHQGYWWLAFELNNYRFSCSLCNSVTTQKYLLGRQPRVTKGGKGMRFPLIDERTRAYEPDHPLHDERLALLDPANPEDCFLLTFDPNGEAVPARSNPEAHERVNTSIVAYHLHRGALVSARERVMRAVREEVTEGDAARKRGDYDVWRGHFFAVRELIGEHAPYTTAARVALKRLAGSEKASRTAKMILNNDCEERDDA